MANFIEELGRARKLERAQFYGDLDSDWVSRAITSTQTWQAVVVTWVRPRAPWYKLNTVASVVNGRARGGEVLRDSKGRLVFAFYKEFGEKRVLQAEALAVLEGLSVTAPLSPRANQRG